MNNFKLKLFVTGASGFIGKNFIKYALSKGYFVYAASSQKQTIVNSNLKWLYGEFDKDWATELEDSNVLVHLAAAGVVNKQITKDEAYEVNVHKSVGLINNACKHKCFNWVIAGSASEYGEVLKLKKPVKLSTKPTPKKIYDRTKYIFTKECIKLNQENNNVRCRIMRIFPVYGKGENQNRLYPSLVRAAKNDLDFTITNGDVLNEFNHIDNVVRGLLSACDFETKNKKFPQIWHLSSGKKTLVKEFAKEHWLKLNASGELIFKDSPASNQYHHFSDKKSLWKV